MIRPHDDGPLVYLCVEPVDGRKQINGLAALVQDTLQMNPFLCGALRYVADEDPGRAGTRLERARGPFGVTYSTALKQCEDSVFWFEA